MNELRTPFGFEDALRPPVDVRRARVTPATLGRASSSATSPTRAQLMRVVRRAPEVMVKITGRTRDGGHLKRHLEYISRSGALVLEGPDGERIDGHGAIKTLAEDWTAELAIEPRRRKDSPVSLSVVLSMPAGTAPHRVHDAARAFAAATFGECFPYVFALHDEGRHPHVHLTVRALGRDGERLNPRKADLQVWRERFAHALRERSVEAEATPRRTRGVTRKAERTPVRKLRERFEAGRGAIPRVLEEALREAVRPEVQPPPWRPALIARQSRIRGTLLAEAARLRRSDRPQERAVAGVLARFLQTMPPVETRREAILRQVDARTRVAPPPDRGRSR